MNEITQDKVKELFEYRDGSLFWKVKLNQRILIGLKAGAFDKDGYVCIKINKKAYKEHRLIYIYHYGVCPDFIDHMNCVRDDNRIENLRLATSAQNVFNAPLRKDNASGVKGVCWHKTTNKWIAQISVCGKRKHLGLFEDLELAELVAIEARNKFHKEFANHGTY
jgi:hypothetical protein